MRKFQLGEQVLAENSPGFQKTLAHAYEQRIRPLCMCKEPPVPTYIACLDGHHHVKRMPLSGRDHDPLCLSYEPPYELSGLGHLIGNAIRIDASGKADLKLGFTLTKKGSKAAQNVSTEPTAPNLHRQPQKLSLRAMLHYLWEAGELTQWRSTWAGKRGWMRVRNSLINAASQMTARGGLLSDILFIPEVFYSSDKAGITKRRNAALKGVQVTTAGPRKLMLIVAEIKEFVAARIGCKIMVRHLPFPLMVEDDIWHRLTRQHQTELQLWRSNEAFHLTAIATFGISSAGIASVEQISLMVVNEHWIPFESIDELQLLERLSVLKRKSIKGLRFNLAHDQPIVSVTLPEQKPAPVAMFIVPAGTDQDYEDALAHMIEARPEMEPWIWRISEQEMPRLP